MLGRGPTLGNTLDNLATAKAQTRVIGLSLLDDTAGPRPTMVLAAPGEAFRFPQGLQIEDNAIRMCSVRLDTSESDDPSAEVRWFSFSLVQVEHPSDKQLGFLDCEVPVAALPDRVPDHVEVQPP